MFQPHAESSLVREWMTDARLKDVLGSIIGAHLPGCESSPMVMFPCRQAGSQLLRKDFKILKSLD